tara:strand:+ start:60 stop:254 length:195 start_codon:yes stop_codon:yes gene_type:complete
MKNKEQILDMIEVTESKISELILEQQKESISPLTYTNTSFMLKQRVIDSKIQQVSALRWVLSKD